jgi:uncharacterized protein YjbI with pentapeptide repeats
LDTRNLRNYNLKARNLRNFDLTNCVLEGTDIAGADLQGTVIEIDQVLSLKNWLLARWSPEILSTLRLPADHNVRVDHRNFTNYDLADRNLSGFDLKNANLRDSVLSRATLQNTDLTGAGMQEATLHNVDLTSARGLRAYQLLGSDVTGATLPPGIAESLKSLPGVEEASKSSRNLLLTVTLACLYCWLTILSTTDASLLVGSSTLALPIVQTPIPVVAFFGAAPVLLLIVYIYLHFSLQNLWDAFATLPAIFEDGRPLHERAFPWLMNSLVRTHFPLLARECPRLPRFQALAAQLLAWWAVPLTLLAFWARFLVRHHALITFLQVLLVALSVWFSLLLWRITSDTLTGVPPASLLWFRSITQPRARRSILVAFLIAALLSVFSLGSFYGKPVNGQVQAPWWRTLVPQILARAAWSPFGDLRGVSLSTRQPDGTIKGAQLVGRNLRHVDANNVLGVNADLRSADLSNSDFEYANLHGVNFALANLGDVNFSDADLSDATFMDAKVKGAKFGRSNLQGANFFRVQDLESTQLADSRNWVLARIDDRELTRLGLCPTICPHESRLDRKDFSGYDLRHLKARVSFKRANLSSFNLQKTNLETIDLSDSNLSNADLRGAVLDGALLYGANLNKADLRGVDLSNTFGLNLTQIESAITDDKIKLPDYLEQQKPFPVRK